MKQYLDETINKIYIIEYEYSNINQELYINIINKKTSNIVKVENGLLFDRLYYNVTKFDQN